MLSDLSQIYSKWSHDLAAAPEGYAYAVNTCLNELYVYGPHTTRWGILLSRLFRYGGVSTLGHFSGLI